MLVRPENIVPWAGKEWPVSEEMQEKIRAHVKTLNEGDQRDNYIKYLTGHCGYKMTF
jgi:hypothetical protein